MRQILPERLSLSRAELEPASRLALIPLVALVIGGACGLVYSIGQSTLYESRSQVVVSPATGFVDPVRSDSFHAISTTVQELALTQSVLADAVRRLTVARIRGTTTSWLRERLRLTISGDTPVLTIAGLDGSPKVASAISTAETDALVNAINAVSNAATTKAATTTTTTTTTTTPKQTTTTTTTGTLAAASGLSLEVFSNGVPSGKVQPQTGRNTLLGASAGLIIGCFALAQVLSRGSRRRSA